MEQIWWFFVIRPLEGIDTRTISSLRISQNLVLQIRSFTWNLIQPRQVTRYCCTGFVTLHTLDSALFSDIVCWIYPDSCNIDPCVQNEVGKITSRIFETGRNRKIKRVPTTVEILAKIRMQSRVSNAKSNSKRKVEHDLAGLLGLVPADLNIFNNLNIGRLRGEI